MDGKHPPAYMVELCQRYEDMHFSLVLRIVDSHCATISAQGHGDESKANLSSYRYAVRVLGSAGSS